MPPKGLPRPNETELKAVALDRERIRPGGPACQADRGTSQRATESCGVNNTVRDLWESISDPRIVFLRMIRLRASITLGDVLSLSPVLMEKYLAAAEKVSRRALFGPEVMKPALVRYQPPSAAAQWHCRRLL